LKGGKALILSGVIVNGKRTIQQSLRDARPESAGARQLAADGLHSSSWRLGPRI
jgi:hypothetical protein